MKKKIQPLEGGALELLRLLVNAIRSGRVRVGEPNTFVTDADMLRTLGHRRPSLRSFKRLRYLGLEELEAWSEAHQPHLPRITAVLVNSYYRRPNSLFVPSYSRRHKEWSRWWLEEAAKAIQYPWETLPFPLEPPLEKRKKLPGAPSRQRLKRIQDNLARIAYRLHQRSVGVGASPASAPISRTAA